MRMLEVEVVVRAAAVAGLRAVAVVPRGQGELVDQFRRAMTSVALNTTEGLGRVGKDRAHFMAMARGSAKEASMALSLLVALQVVPDEVAGPVEANLDRARAMLWRMAH